MSDSTFDLRAWMDEHGWSVRKLAIRLDCAPRTVQAYAAGEETMPFIWRLALDRLVALDEEGGDWSIVNGALVAAERTPA